MTKISLSSLWSLLSVLRYLHEQQWRLTGWRNTTIVLAYRPQHPCNVLLCTLQLQLPSLLNWTHFIQDNKFLQQDMILIFQSLEEETNGENLQFRSKTVYRFLPELSSGMYLIIISIIIVKHIASTFNKIILIIYYLLFFVLRIRVRPTNCSQYGHIDGI